jgi:hypothetical protein
MRNIPMRKFGSKNDWWDWGVILLLAAGGTIILWASVWVAHSLADARRDAVTAEAAPPVVMANVCPERHVERAG